MPIAAARPACASPAQRRYLGIRQRSKAGDKFAVPFFLVRLAQLHHLVHGLLVCGVARLQHLHHMLLAGRTHCLGGFTRYHRITRPAPHPAARGNNRCVARAGARVACDGSARHITIAVILTRT